MFENFVYCVIKVKLTFLWKGQTAKCIFPAAVSCKELQFFEQIYLFYSLRKINIYHAFLKSFSCLLIQNQLSVKRVFRGIKPEQPLFLS